MRVPDCFDYYDAEEMREPGDYPAPRCNRCGSTEVRWRQQGGGWKLFSLQPGVEHRCAPSADDFDAVPE